MNNRKRLNWGSVVGYRATPDAHLQAAARTVRDDCGPAWYASCRRFAGGFMGH